MKSNSYIDKPSIAFVAIDIQVENVNFKAYKLQTAAKKIDQIKNRIIAICKSLKEKESKKELQKNSMWIVAWREYGITEDDSRVITQETKLLFKKVMQELTDQYPQLTIIAGTVATRKKINKSIAQAKIESIKDRYAQIAAIEQKEISTGESNEVKHHFDKVLAVEDIAAEKGFNVIRNTCFIFPGNYKRSKIAPFQEINNPKFKNSVFYPGRFDNCIFPLQRHGTDDVFTVGIEICRENYFNILQVAGKKQPLLHLVLSDSIELTAVDCISSYMIQIDSQDGIQYLDNEDPAAPKLAVYSLDLLNNFNMKAVHRHSRHPVSPLNQRSRLLDTVSSENLFESVVFSGELTREFIQKHIKDIDRPCGNRKYTALHYVVINGDQDLALFLLQQGANPNVQDANGKTPASLVLEGSQDIEVLAVLINAHADLRIKDKAGRTAFDKLQQLISVGDLLSRELIRIRDEYLSLESANRKLSETVKIKKRHNKVLLPERLFKATPSVSVPVAESTRAKKRIRV